MTPLQWIKMFAVFVPVADAIVDAFVAKHPELGEPPPEPAKDAIDAAHRRALDDRFPPESGG